MPIARNPCVYILASKPRGMPYIGVTSDLVKRIWQHREGNSGGFASRYEAHLLFRYELFGDMEQAILREKQLKNWQRQWKINLIERDNPHWDDMAAGLGFEQLASPGTRDGS